MKCTKNKQNYFVVSDIHGFAKELKSALFMAGFRKSCKNHILIICGDIFDRGSEAVEVYNFIKSIPQDRRILIKGNHEELYFDLLKKRYPEEHDFSNHTVDTFCQIAGRYYAPGCKDRKTTMEDYLATGCYSFYGMVADSACNDPLAQEEWLKIRNIIKNHEITKFLASDEWKDYYELDKYIFVHSFIPVNNDDGLPSYYIKNRKQSYKKDWRTNATELEWADARWGCPWRQYKAGLFKEEEAQGKMLVCGHWHTDDFFKALANDFATSQAIFCGKGIIAIDCGVYIDKLHKDKTGKYKYIHPQNVLVIGSDFKAYDGKFKMPLADMTPQPFKVIATVSDPKKIDYRLDIGQSTVDMTLCCADCAAHCERRTMPEGICTVSDLSNVCKSYIKKNNN